LRKSETAKFLLANHSADFFPFLEISHQSKNRSRYYSSLAKILFAGEPDTFEQGFYEFGMIMLFIKQLNLLRSLYPNLPKFKTQIKCERIV
jgi:hypothetical protein